MEKPILFSTAMIQAILAGRKTQTRRAIKPQPVKNGAFWELYGAGWSEDSGSIPCVHGHSLSTRNPYGQPGDILWVRETWALIDDSDFGGGEYYEYFADNDNPLPGEWPEEEKENTTLRWKPSIHMPREAARLFLRVKSVRVERLQGISVEDARAEGISKSVLYYRGEPHKTKGTPKAYNTAKEAFAGIWDSINAAPKPVYEDGEIVSYISYPWDDIQETRTYRGKPWLVYGNPWVWVVEFDVVA